MAAVVYPLPESYRGTAPRPRAAANPPYGRRRAIAGALLAAVAFAAQQLLTGLGGGSPLTAPEAAPSAFQSVAARVHVVQPGDTLWSIARALEPEGDVREVVDQLAAMHGTTALQVGERVTLP